MEYPLNEAMQSTLAVLTTVAPGDLDALAGFLGRSG